MAIGSLLYIFPWDNYGMTVPTWVKPYKLGLDLNGWVELDYKVDLTEVRAQSGQINEANIIDSLKNIIDRRVRSLWLEEPTIQTAQYGPGESHIIVQIPVKDYGNISDDEKRKKNAEDIKNAKDTIGKVVKLEFKEEKKDITEADKQERRDLAEKARAELATTPFATIAAKYRDQYENVVYISTSGTLLPQAKFDGYEKVTKFPHVSEVYYSPGEEMVTLDTDGKPTTTKWPGGYAITELLSMTEKDAPVIGTWAATKQKEYVYSVIYVDERPSTWTVAKTSDGKALNDKYLTRAWVAFTPAGSPQVELIFNDDGKKIFGDLTKRLLGKPIAIFVWGELLTAPTVQAVISDGRAVITGDYTVQWAQELANGINTGIVPAPIYLTSERTIDAKIGRDALKEILYAGIIGLAAIIVLLVYFYHVGGLLAGIALIVYSLILIALVKFSSVTLTLASIAWVILSIGLAIDANILIFERMKESLRAWHHMEKAITTGFAKSWTAIWDSHITSLTSAVILYVFGISLIKGFGLMLGLGIVLSLFTAMWVSRVLIAAVWKTKIGENAKLFVGHKE
jgi:protein-export membrane protein SecD